MNLANYIQYGKPCKNSYLTFVFGVIALVFSTVFYFLSSYLLQKPEMVQMINSIPEIQIENGKVIQPLNIIFEKKIPFSTSYLLIDTNQETPTKTVESGIMLTKTTVVISINNQIQIYPLPEEKLVLDTETLTQLLAKGTKNMAVILGVTLFIMLWLGFMIGLILTHILLRMFRKQTDRNQVKRATFAGWMGVVILNTILICFGYALPFILSVPVAVTISLFCIIKTSVSQ